VTKDLSEDRHQNDPQSDAEHHFDCLAAAATSRDAQRDDASHRREQRTLDTKQHSS
jgi:hypothetical protein